MLAWLQAHAVDILAIQETKLIDDDFPQAEFSALGYQVVYSGQKTYNGVALVSRLTPEAVQCDMPDFVDPQRRILKASYGDLCIINLYVPNGQSVDSDKYQYKLRWLAALREWLAAEAALYQKLVVLGDFNIAPEDRDVHDPAAWEGSVLVSPAERQAFTALLQTGLVDTYRIFEQPPQSFTWWDYRTFAFRRNRGLRIDLILASQWLSQQCRAVSIDCEPRKAERPSDHTPVIANFDI